MISICHLYEQASEAALRFKEKELQARQRAKEKSAQYKPFQVGGTPVSSGGKGFPLRDIRVSGRPSPAQELAQQKALTQREKVLTHQQIIDARKRRNPTQQERQQGL